MELMVWFSSGTALNGRRECALSQNGASPDMTVDTASSKNNKQTINNSV